MQINQHERIHSFIVSNIFLVCPMPGCKKIRSFYLKADFIANKFELDDIFEDHFLKELKNTSKFSITTIRTINFGQCYSIQALKNISGLEFEDCIKFRKEFDVYLLVHTEGNTITLPREKNMNYMKIASKKFLLP